MGSGRNYIVSSQITCTTHPILKTGRMRWAGACSTFWGEERVLVGKPEGKRPLGRQRHRWEDNIKMDLQEVGCELDQAGSG